MSRLRSWWTRRAERKEEMVVVDKSVEDGLLRSDGWAWQ
jgi:hypothetical protein